MFAARLSSALTASYELLTRQVCRGTAGISAAPSHDEFRGITRKPDLRCEPATVSWFSGLGRQADRFCETPGL